MKKTLLLFFFSFGFIFTNAQFKEIASGPSFEEPRSGASKMLLMKNGNVLLLRVGTKADGIDIRIYDRAQKEIVVNSFDPAYGKLKDGGLEAAFEINGDVVLLVSETDDKRPILHRLIIDGTNGKLKKEEKILQLQKLNKKMEKAVNRGNASAPDFYASKDPDSDNYAVALFNSFEANRSKQIEIVLYGADHEEINRAYYESPDEKYKYMQFVSMAVMGSERVSVLANGVNPGEDRESEVVLATLKKDVSIVSYSELKFPKDQILENGIVRYNPYTKKLIVVAKIREDAEKIKEGKLYMALLDPTKEKTEKFIQAGVSDEVAKRTTEIYGANSKFRGIPVSVNINKDGGFTVVYEESGVVVVQWSDHTSAHRETWDIMVSTFDKDAKLISSYLVTKNFFVDSQGSATYGGGFGNQYKKFAYINGPEKSYILINDTRRNIEQQEIKKKPIQVIGVSGCDAFYFPLTGTDPMPKRQYLFGEPSDPKERRLAPFGVSVYDKEHDVFIVLKLNNDGRKKSVNVVWLKPQ